MLGEIGHRFLLKMDPEKAHKKAISVMKKGWLAPGRFTSIRACQQLFDVTLDNPLGISAGFDKYAEVVDKVRDYGFGFIEEGSFTFRGGAGNPNTRLFRLSNGGLLNRMGLNCISADKAACILASKDQTSFAVSIAKTHDPKIVGDSAIQDIKGSYSLLNNLGIYTAINLSCPNTAEGKTFEDPGALRELFSALNEIGDIYRKPRVIKFSPNLSRKDLVSLIEIAEPHVDGYEAVNTLPSSHPIYGNGGESGPNLYPLALKTVRTIREVTNKPIIAVGGIRSGLEMLNLEKAGANAFLAYTGFVYGSKHSGPNFAHRVLEEFVSFKDIGA